MIRAALQHGTRIAFSTRMVLRNQFFSATILQLVEYFGLVDLALMLDVDPDDLLRWAEGKDRPPVDVFLRVIDLRNGCRAKA